MRQFLKPKESLKMGDAVANRFKSLFEQNPKLGSMNVTFAKGKPTVERAWSVNNRRMSKPDVSDVDVRGIAKLNGQRVTIYQKDAESDVFALVW